jgi:hypothetical protein
MRRNRERAYLSYLYNIAGGSDFEYRNSYILLNIYKFITFPGL